MKNRWDDRQARSFVARYKADGADLALRTYSARLIGQDPSLVLHGGGNTSVKTVKSTLTSEQARVICIKGSGWDLATIEPQGHPAVKMDALERLRALPRLSDEDMVNALRTNMLDSAGPTPSVETLLHAFLPHRFIDHTHADAVLSITNQPDSEERTRAWVGKRLGVVPYIMPGFALAKLAAEIYERDPQVEGLVLIKHGIFTFGETAKQSYERMIVWVDRAERQIAKSKRFALHPLRIGEQSDSRSVAIAANLLRGQCFLTRSTAKQQDARQPLIVRHRADDAILQFVTSREAARLSQQGPATPDHVIRTKAKPLLMPPVPVDDESAFSAALRARLASYVKAYTDYFKRQTRIKRVVRTPLDPIPRVILVPGVGMFGLGVDVKAADVALDIYQHTIDVIINASRIGRYEALPDGDLFDLEYWSLEQAKLGKTVEKPFAGKVVWISGAAAGIGLATARAFARHGAHLFLTDRDGSTLETAVENLDLSRQVASAACDVTQRLQVEAAFERCSATFGGVDIVVSNAGVAPMHDIASCPDPMLRQSYEVNFFAHQYVAQAAVRIFERQGLGGVLLFNASKSAFNPGPGFGPYTLPKAGVIALMRQYAVEVGKIGVRVNAVNADRVQTGLYAGGLLAKRAKARGLSLDEYIKGNLLGEEVFAEDVAQAFVSLAQARKTTGAVLPVDGGNAAAFPR
jgi:rhamnose utilization protein RhaD (predicted bifunctional aldolase and dehydrogenase)/NAD(P)-dependent dehydrogenase (short-subunit alcohol dehydrogenase family)